MGQQFYVFHQNVWFLSETLSHDIWLCMQRNVYYCKYCLSIFQTHHGLKKVQNQTETITFIFLNKKWKIKFKTICKLFFLKFSCTIACLKNENVRFDFYDLLRPQILSPITWYMKKVAFCLKY